MLKHNNINEIFTVTAEGIQVNKSSVCFIPTFKLYCYKEPEYYVSHIKTMSLVFSVRNLVESGDNFSLNKCELFLSKELNVDALYTASQRVY